MNAFGTAGVSANGSPVALAYLAEHRQPQQIERGFGGSRNPDRLGWPNQGRRFDGHFVGSWPARSDREWRPAGPPPRRERGRSAKAIVGAASAAGSAAAIASATSRGQRRTWRSTTFAAIAEHMRPAMRGHESPGRPGSERPALAARASHLANWPPVPNSTVASVCPLGQESHVGVFQLVVLFAEDQRAQSTCGSWPRSAPSPLRTLRAWRRQR